MWRGRNSNDIHDGCVLANLSGKWFFLPSSSGNDGQETSGSERANVENIEFEYVSDLINELYPVALDCDISSFLFWESSVLEITDYIESYRRKEKRKQKQTAIDNHILADQLLKGISVIFSEENKAIEINELWDYYPGLFEEEKKQHLIEQEENEFENFKARRMKFANAYNKKFKGDD